MTTSEPAPTEATQSAEGPPHSVAFPVPEGYVLGYHVIREAWYHEFSRIPGDKTVLMVGLYGLRGGCRWEFAIDEEHVRGTCLRVKVFDEAWQAFAAIPEVFAALGAEPGRAMVEEVVEVLDSFGFRDLTPRVNPHTHPSA